MPEEAINKQTSKYKGAIQQIIRLDYIWQECHRNSHNGNLKGWNDCLDSAWRELASDTKNTTSKHFTKIKKYNDLIIQYKSNRNILNQVLMRKEIFLRRLENSQGKGMDYNEEDIGL